MRHYKMIRRFPDPKTIGNIYPYYNKITEFDRVSVFYLKKKKKNEKFKR